MKYELPKLLSIYNWRGGERGNVAPCPLLVNMVAAGKLGRKSGEGFYDYSGGGKELVVSGRYG